MLFRSLGKISAVRDGFLELPGVASREDARAARAALRIGRERVFEKHALVRDAVEVRRLDPVAAVRARVRAAIPVVEDDEEDVWPRRVRCKCRSHGDEECGEKTCDEGGGSLLHGERGIAAGVRFARVRNVFSDPMQPESQR